MMDLYLSDTPTSARARSQWSNLTENLSCLAALRKLGQSDDALGHVTSKDGKTVGFVTGRELRMAFLRVT